MDHLEGLKALNQLTGQHIEDIEAGVAPSAADWKSIVRTILQIVLQFLSTPTAGS